MGTTINPSDVSNEEVRLAWMPLWTAAMRYGVPPDDAKDLVQEAILKSLSAFDPGKGEFLALAKTVVANLAKNYWKTRKRHGGGTEPDDLPGEDEFSERWEEEEMRSLLTEIMKTLQPDEKTFLTTLGGLLEEAEGRMVAEAARVCGLTVDQGWNLMRKIERKAQKVRGVREAVFFEKKEDRMLADLSVDLHIPASLPPSPMPSASRIPSLSREVAILARLALREKAFHSFLGSLSADHRQKLARSLRCEKFPPV
jgi:DNA-directed RNA polymerase specialized sigma24 family protein